MDERESDPSEPERSNPHTIVHLRRRDYENPAVRARWHSRGYSTMPPMEGHDPYIRCPICSTDEEPEKPDCPYCGQGPCFFSQLLKRSD